MPTVPARAGISPANHARWRQAYNKTWVALIMAILNDLPWKEDWRSGEHWNLYVDRAAALFRIVHRLAMRAFIVLASIRQELHVNLSTRLS
jgi:hypothetical protein